MGGSSGVGEGNFVWLGPRGERVSWSVPLWTDVGRTARQLAGGSGSAVFCSQTHELF